MLDGKTVCVVNVDDKRLLTKKITSLGGKVSSSVSKSTYCLVTKKNVSSKAKDNAILLGVTIYDPESFIEKFIDSDDEKVEQHSNAEPEQNYSNNESEEETDDKDKADDFSTPKKKVKVGHFSLPTPQLTKASSSNEHTLEFGSLFLKLRYPFVDRVNAAKELFEQLIFQKSEKGVLPILSQHFGAGKTSLVENFQQVLKLETNKDEQYDPIIFTYVKNAVVIVLNCASIFSTNGVDMGRNSTCFCYFVSRLEIELEAALKERGDDIELEKSLAVIKAINQPHIPRSDDIQILVNRLSIGGMNNFLIAWSSLKLYPLLLFFDEITSLENNVADKRGAIISFWQYFSTFIFGSHSMKNIFMVVAGKSATLTMLGRSMVVNDGNISPTPAKHIVLDLFNEEHIIELVQRTFISKSITMENFLLMCNIGDNLGYFYKLVKEYTGGIPRLVVYLMQSITKYCKKNNRLLNLSSRDLIDQTFKSKDIMVEVLGLAETNPLGTIHPNHPSLQIYRHLCTFAALEIPVKIEEKTISLIYELNIGMEEIGDDGYFSLSIPKFVDMQSVFDPSIGILKNVYSHGFARMSQITDKGALLEVLTRDTLILRLLSYMSSQKNWAEIHVCFSKSKILKDRKIELSRDYIKFMPKVVTSKTNPKSIQEIRDEKKHPWKMNVIDTDWPKLKTVFFQTNCFVHPAPLSRSSDLFFSLGEDMALCFAIKNYPSTIFSIKILQEEIDKSFLMTQSKEGNSFQNIALFVVCVGIENSNINKLCNNDSCLVLSSGKYDLTNGTLNRIGDFKHDYSLLRNTPNDINQYSTNTTNQMVFVPKNMEVIVLGAKALTTFFTKEDMNQLAVLSTSYPNADYLKDFFHSLPLNLSFTDQD